MGPHLVFLCATLKVSCVRSTPANSDRTLACVDGESGESDLQCLDTVEGQRKEEITSLQLRPVHTTHEDQTNHTPVTLFGTYQY